jgi:hypothetical protein
MEVRERRTYFDERGRQINEYRFAYGDLGTGISKWLGTAVLQLNGPRGPAQLPYTFDIPAETLEQAYDRFDAGAEKRGAELIKEASQPKIAMPVGLPPPKPNGFVPKAMRIVRP